MQNKILDLQIVLNEMFASKDDLSLRDVRIWQEKYPEFRREIAEAYADWREFEFFVLSDEEAAIIDIEVSAERKNQVENALAQFRGQTDEEIENLRETAEKKGVARATFLNALGVSETLMRKLERRNLTNIPRTILGKISEILQVSTDSLQAFFDQPPMLPKTARYKSKTAPRTQPKQPFAKAVRQDMELTDEEKQELLNLD